MIAAHGLGKRFRIYDRPHDRLVEWLSGGRVKRHADFWALRGVSLTVRRGECLGVIGANGSGKSTLMKLITGALHATEGTVRVRGRLVSLLDLGTGINPQLTGRAGVAQAARMMGFDPEYARSSMEEIAAFADLGEFFDRPVGLYSAGMRVRLGFAMFACLRPEVFLVDEALSVGDVFFQQKCAARLRAMLDDGLTMLFASHDQGAVLNLCDRAVLLEHGRAVFEGDPAQALSRYTANLRGGSRRSPPRHRSTADAARAGTPASRSEADAIIARDVIGRRSEPPIGAGALRVAACRVTDAQGRDSLRAYMGDALTFHVLIEASGSVTEPRVGVQFFNRFSALLFACGTRMLGHELPAMSAGDRLIVRLEVAMDLEPGQYSFSVSTSEPDENDRNSGITHDSVPDLGPLLVTLDSSKPRPFFGAARLPVRATHARVVP